MGTHGANGQEKSEPGHCKAYVWQTSGSKHSPAAKEGPLKKGAEERPFLAQH